MRTCAKSVIVIVCLGAAAAWAPFADAQEQSASPVIPAERRPYDVRLLVAFDPTSADSMNSPSVLVDVDRAARRCVGDLWSLRASEIKWLSLVSARGLERVDRTDFARHYPGDFVDVWFVAAVESRAAGTRVSVRSWQPDVQSQTQAVSMDVFDLRDLPIVLLRLCRDLMRPMGVVEEVDGKRVQIRLRAGELVPPDPSFNQLMQGDLLLPQVAYRDKNRVIERLQSIPWTFVSVDSVEGSTVVGTIQSGLRSPLSGKKRNRIDTVVSLVRPERASTRLELVTQGKTPLSLVAHRIEVRADASLPRPSKEQPDIDPNSNLLTELLTDRRGIATVAIQPEHPLIWLFAYSGDNLLVRVPLIPGLVPGVRLEVADDSTRLTAEADLQMIQGEVIDAVALRNTAFTTIRAASKKDDWTSVNQKLVLLKRLQDAGTLLDRLNAVRVAGTAAATARKDRVAEARINRSCDDTEALIKTHLSDDKVRLLIEEMEALQSAAAAKEKPDAPDAGAAPKEQ